MTARPNSKAPLTFTTSGTIKAATLSRGKIVFATGEFRKDAKITQLVLEPLRKLVAGSYTLKIGVACAKPCSCSETDPIQASIAGVLRVRPEAI